MDINTEHYLIASGSDHEPSESASDQSVPSHHRITNGYKICIHTCTGLTCISRKTKTILWNKEGHVVCKHAANKNMHPQCTRGFFLNCPSRECLGQTKTLSFRGRDATEEELALYIGVGIDTPRVDTDMKDELWYPTHGIGTIDGRFLHDGRSSFQTYIHSRRFYEDLQQGEGPERSGIHTYGAFRDGIRAFTASYRKHSCCI